MLIVLIRDCANDPINLFDPSGNYYLVNDPYYGYSLRRDNLFTSWGKTICGLFVPGGGAINAAMERGMFGVVGGNSATSDQDATMSLAFTAFGYISKGYNIISAVVDGYDKTTGAISSIGQYDIYVMDKIAFSLSDDVSLGGPDKGALEMKMQKAYNFILNNDKYFSQIVFDGQTLYDIQSKIADSDNPSKVINKYYRNIKNTLIGNGMSAEDAILYANSFKKHYMDNASDIIKAIKDQFKQAVED